MVGQQRATESMVIIIIVVINCFTQAGCSRHTTLFAFAVSRKEHILWVVIFYHLVFHGRTHSVLTIIIVIIIITPLSSYFDKKNDAVCRFPRLRFFLFSFRPIRVYYYYYYTSQLYAAGHVDYDCNFGFYYY